MATDLHYALSLDQTWGAGQARCPAMWEAIG